MNGRMSHFQGFYPNWIVASKPLSVVLQCPSSPLEVFEGLRRRISERCRGGSRYSIAIKSPRALDNSEPTPFMVLVTTAVNDDWGRDYCAKQRRPILHIPEVETEGESGWSLLSASVFESFAKQVCEELGVDVDRLRRNLIANEQDAPAQPLEFSGELNVQANQLPFLSIGYPNIRPGSVTSGSGTAGDDARAFREMAKTRAEWFADSYPLGSTCLLLTAPSLDRRLPNVLKDRHRNDESAGVARAYRDVMEWDALTPLPEAPAGRALDGASAEIVAERNRELVGHRWAVNVESCSQFLPTAILSKESSRLRERCRRLQELFSWQHGNWRADAASTAKRIGKELSSQVPDHVWNYLSDSRGTIKAITDQPVELLTLDSLPLSMTRAVVRVPATPGALLARQTVNTASITLGRRSECGEVLVLRGTHPTDPIYDQLETLASAVAKEAEVVALRVVDVATSQDIERALMAFSGATVVFDAHGIHSTRSHGVLQIGDKELHMHGLNARMPPIVFLAACETHGLGSDSNSVAAAILDAGARVVVGTMTEVSASSASLLLSDLVGRIGQWVPAYGGPIRFSELFAASQWVCHAAEAAFVLRSEGVVDLDGDAIGRFLDGLEAPISRLDPCWFDTAYRDLARLANVEPEVIRAEWLARAYVTDVSMYCQLGHGDTVFLEGLVAG